MHGFPGSPLATLAGPLMITARGEPMRAVQFDRFGGPEVLAEVECPDPVPGDGEVLVEVEAAGVNFGDTKNVAGQYTPPEALPHVPGMEVVGRTADGTRVLGYLTSGGYASLAAVRE